MRHHFAPCIKIFYTSHNWSKKSKKRKAKKISNNIKSKKEYFSHTRSKCWKCWKWWIFWNLIASLKYRICTFYEWGTSLIYHASKEETTVTILSPYLSNILRFIIVIGIPASMIFSDVYIYRREQSSTDFHIFFLIFSQYEYTHRVFFLLACIWSVFFSTKYRILARMS